jgi:hypothetical protein
MYSLPWGGVNVAGNLQYRQGYPYPRVIQVTNRGNLLGQRERAAERHGRGAPPERDDAGPAHRPAVHDGRRPLHPEPGRLQRDQHEHRAGAPSDRRTYNHSSGAFTPASNYDQISGIIAPRVLRFGVRMTW